MATKCLWWVFVENERRGYAVISLVEEYAFPLYRCTLSTSIPRPTRRHCHFRLCIWAESWYPMQSKRRGHGLKTQGQSFPTKPQTRPPAGAGQAKCVGPVQNKRALFQASSVRSGWCGRRWHGVRGACGPIRWENPPIPVGTEHCQAYGPLLWHPPSSEGEHGGKKKAKTSHFIEWSDRVNLKYLSAVAGFDTAKKLGRRRDHPERLNRHFFQQRA